MSTNAHEERTTNHPPPWSVCPTNAFPTPLQSPFFWCLGRRCVTDIRRRLGDPDRTSAWSLRSLELETMGLGRTSSSFICSPSPSMCQTPRPCRFRRRVRRCEVRRRPSHPTLSASRCRRERGFFRPSWDVGGVKFLRENNPSRG